MVKVKLDKKSWQTGYNAGRRRASSLVPEGVEAMSWHSGYIEGKAAPAMEFCTCSTPTCKYRDTERLLWICESCQKPLDEPE